jgi:hypothetical protein
MLHKTGPKSDKYFRQIGSDLRSKKEIIKHEIQEYFGIIQENKINYRHPLCKHMIPIMQAKRLYFSSKSTKSLRIC